MRHATSDVPVLVPFKTIYTANKHPTANPFVDTEAMLEEQEDGSLILWMWRETPEDDQRRIIEHFRGALPPALPCLHDVSPTLTPSASPILEVS